MSETGYEVEAPYSCAECGLHFYYDPEFHRCSLTAGRYGTGESWIEECIRKQSA